MGTFDVGLIVKKITIILFYINSRIVYMLRRKLKFKALCNVFILNLNHEKCVQFKTLNGKLHI